MNNITKVNKKDRKGASNDFREYEIVAGVAKKEAKNNYDANYEILSIGSPFFQCINTERENF